MQFGNFPSLRGSQCPQEAQCVIPFWDNPNLELPLLARPVKWKARLSKSLYDEEYRRLIDVLANARRGRGLTQQEVADKLGRPQSFIAKVEGFERRLDVIEFIRYCRAIGVEPKEFL